MDPDHTTGQAAAHHEVAAYALGVLGPAEAVRYEEHLARCSRCAEELEQLLPMVGLLTQADESWLATPPSEPTPTASLTGALASRPVAASAAPTAGAAAWTRAPLALSGSGPAGSGPAGSGPGRRGRPRRVLLPTAALSGLLLLAGATILAAAPDHSQLGEPPVSIGPITGVGGLGGSELPQPERLSATDPVTRIFAEVELTDQPWGTNLTLTLTGLAGPRDCQLLLVYDDGATELAGSWWVSPDGYGVPGQPEPLRVTAVVAGPREELVELRVMQVTSSGATDSLVAVSL